MTPTTYTIDATGQTLGRVASKAAKMLRGKSVATFEPHIEPKVKVTIVNASKIEVDPRKMLDKEYLEYSGYPGGQRSFSMQELIARRGYKGIFEKAVNGMLPDNKHRKRIIQNLIVEE